jgi:hypothetical protein
LTSILFLGFVAFMTTVAGAIVARYLNRTAAFTFLGCLSVWFSYAGLLGHFGVIRNITTRPPGVIFLVGPVALFLAVSVVPVLGSTTGKRIALAFPLWILVGLQCFRIGVELFLHQLWIDGLVPKMLTFAGANVDIYIGASAPLIAWLTTRGRVGVNIALAWNFLGLIALANVVARALLTAPGPLNLIHAEVPDRMFGTFPFLFIPAFFVPLGVVLHVLAIRSILSRQHAGAGVDPAGSQGLQRASVSTSTINSYKQ